MEVALGFVIALAIALTGVGAGSMTTPLLILLLHVSPASAVGTALAFGTIVKVVSVPVYAVRRQVSLKVLGLLLVGGLPGVIAGGFVLDRVKNGSYEGPLYALLGGLIVVTAGFHFYRQLRPSRGGAKLDRSRFLPWIALPIGAEVGFSSAGAGALGSLVLLSFTRLSTAEVIGTDLCFGLAVSFVGSVIQISAGNYDGTLLLKLVIGGVLGAVTGSFLAGRVPQRALRFGLLSVLIVLGIQLALHAKSVPAQQQHAMLHSPMAKPRAIAQP